jgi:hypothetical protein
MPLFGGNDIWGQGGHGWLCPFLGGRRLLCYNITVTAATRRKPLIPAS